jgi:integrase
LEEIRQARIYGVRPDRIFRIAATKYLTDKENEKKPSAVSDAYMLQSLDPFIGEIPLSRIHDGTLLPYITARQKVGIKSKSINNALSIVSRILILAARKWRDEHNLTWLETPPLLSMLATRDSRKPYPLSWDEQSAFFQELPDHLVKMALFNVNTGTREQEVCKLRWDWEIEVPELGASVFLIPEDFGGRTEYSGVKNDEDRLVVLNDVARSVVDSCRGKHPERVFTFEDEPVDSMNNSAWGKARIRNAMKLYVKSGKSIPPELLIEGQRGILITDELKKFMESAMPGLANVRDHDLKHTFGRRLRAAGVSLETRKVLLGHKNGDITSHYSAAEIDELLKAANRVCRVKSGKSPAITLLKRKIA